MSRNYYVLSNGRVQREANTLSIINEQGVKKPIPVEDVESLYLYGEVDINTKLLNFLSQKRIALHVFNYYGFYSGSYYPREYLNSGHLLVKQVQRYGDAALRLELVKELVRGSAHSILRNVSYYSRRRAGQDDGETGRRGDGENEEDDPVGEIGAPITNSGVPTDEIAEAAVDAALSDTIDSPPHLTSPARGEEPNAATPREALTPNTSELVSPPHLTSPTRGEEPDAATPREALTPNTSELVSPPHLTSPTRGEEPDAATPREALTPNTSELVSPPHLTSPARGEEPDAATPREALTPNTSELVSPPHLTSPTRGEEPTAATPNTSEANADPFVCSVDVEGGAATPLEQLRRTIESIVPLIETQPDVNSLRGVEGKIRERYYQSWRHILAEGFYFTQRVRRPPDNEINALISFGNSMLYTVCLSEIYRTQLTPTISYLHEPGVRRFSLALDLSEIFKPLIVDRAIFTLVNRGQLKPEHFDRTLDGCYLTEAGKKLYLGELETRLATTIKHRRLGRHVSYRHLIRLECYKLIRDLTGVEAYKAFRAWW